jgi:hypothetical protein
MKFKILLRKTPVDEYAQELCYDAFNSNFLNSLHMTYWLFIMYSKASLYLISNVKLEGLVSIPTPDYIFIEELEKHNLLSIIERNKDESVKRNRTKA